MSNARSLRGESVCDRDHRFSAIAQSRGVPE